MPNNNPKCIEAWRSSSRKSKNQGKKGRVWNWTWTAQLARPPKKWSIFPPGRWKSITLSIKSLLCCQLLPPFQLFGEQLGLFKALTCIFHLYFGKTGCSDWWWRFLRGGRCVVPLWGLDTGLQSHAFPCRLPTRSLFGVRTTPDNDQTIVRASQRTKCAGAPISGAPACAICWPPLILAVPRYKSIAGWPCVPHRWCHGHEQIQHPQKRSSDEGQRVRDLSEGEAQREPCPLPRQVCFIYHIFAGNKERL